MNLKVNRRFPWIHYLDFYHFPILPLFCGLYSILLWLYNVLLTPSISLCNCSTFYSSKHHLMTWLPLSQFHRTSTSIFISGCLITCPLSDFLTEWLARISSVVRYLRFRKIQFRDVSGHLSSVHPVRELHRNLPLKNFQTNSVSNSSGKMSWSNNANW